MDAGFSLRIPQCRRARIGVNRDDQTIPFEFAPAGR
jgi:hypothetical protein